jgi:hypothetical protein
MARIYSVRGLCLLLRLYRSDQFYWLRKPDIPGKTTDLPHVTDKLYYFMLYRMHLAMNGMRKHNVGGARVLIVQVVVNPTTMPCDHDHDGTRQDLYTR